MVKVLICRNVILFVKKHSLKNQIIKKFEKLKTNPKLGDYVFGIGNIDCREIKVEGLRFFTIKYRDEEFVLDSDEFKNILKIVDYANKNKSKNQQKIINDIKDRLKEFGMGY